MRARLMGNPFLVPSFRFIHLFNSVLKGLLLLLNTVLLAACGSPQFTVQPQPDNLPPVPKYEIVVFFDGTANDESSRTNVAKLHNLVSLQKRDDLHTIYIKGVGTSGLAPSKLLGMGLGMGIGKDVLQAYEFIATRYRGPQDKIYLFGFSRGSYAARILAGFIEVAGIASLEGMTDKQKEKALIKIYNAYLRGNTREEKEDAIRASYLVSRPAKIEFMGLWDTVAALGWPGFNEKFHDGELEEKYFDQLCNIKSAAHAMSIDDNRARSFTPVILARPELGSESKCGRPVNVHEIVDEVWFLGAHSDVGGGYHDTDIDGISLNWMLGKVRPHGIIPDDSMVFENPNGKIHAPGSGSGLGIIYWNQNRHLPGYVNAAKYPNDLLPIHESVVERLGPGGKGKAPIGFDWVSSVNEKYRECFKVDPVIGDLPDCNSKQCNLELKDDQKCFAIRKTDYPSQ